MYYMSIFKTVIDFFAILDYYLFIKFKEDIYEKS